MAIELIQGQFQGLLAMPASLWTLSFPAIAISAWLWGHRASLVMCALSAGVLSLLAVSNSVGWPAAAQILGFSAIGAWGALCAWVVRLPRSVARASQEPPLLHAASNLELVEAQRLARLGNWRLDFASGAVQWSEVLYDIFGLDPSGPAPDYATQTTIFTAESFARLDVAVRNAIATGTPYTLDLEIRHTSGEPRWITARGEAIRDSAGHIVALRGTANDITERQQLLLALRERERALQLTDQRFRASFNSMFQFMGILAPDGTLLEVNEAAALVIDGPASEQVGKPFWETYWWRISEATRNGIRDAVARAARGEVVRYDVDILDPRDQRLTVDFSIKPVRDTSGRVVLLVPEGRDVTEERRTREALRKAQERFQAIFDSTFQFIGVLTPDGTLIEANQAAVDFSGLPKEQLINQPFWDCH